jgi:hypothetical protein
MKSATTTLAHLLSQTQHVVMCKVKEPNYFCKDLHEHPEFPLALTQFRHFNEAWITEGDEYQSLFPSSGGGTKWIVDASPTYMYSQEAAENIFRFNPDARIICLLRNPIDRAYSEYMMNMIKGLVGDTASRSKGFLQTMHQDYTRYVSGSVGLFERYIDAGMYNLHLLRYFRLFAPDQIMVEVIDEPGHTFDVVLDRVDQFLGLSVPRTNEVRLNTARKPIWPSFNAWLHSAGVKAMISNHVPRRLKEIAKSTYYSSNDIGGPSFGERKYLSLVFRDDIHRLEELLGRDLGFWLAD